MHGLLNLGNTCYFNSAIQCLLHTNPISEYIYKTDYKGECGFSIIYQNLLRKYFSTQESGCFNPEPLLKKFIETFPRFKINEPHDAQDALFCIIDILERAFPEIKNLVYGEKLQITICPTGKNTMKMPFSIQTLSSENGEQKVSQLLIDSMKWHTLTDYIDEEGNRHNVSTTRTLFKTFPKVMFISFDKKTRVKLEDTLTINDEIVYELSAYVIHRGIQIAGHYTSAAKFGDKWVAHDDENLFSVNPKEVDGYYILTYIAKSP